MDEANEQRPATAGPGEAGPEPAGERVAAHRPATELAVQPEAARRVERMVATFVERLVGVDPHTDDYRQLIAGLDRLGDREIVATSAMSGRLLDRRFRAMRGLLEGKAPIARQLVELRQIVEDLNPARHEFRPRRAWRGFGGPARGSELDEYFEQFHRSQGRIEELLIGLGNGRIQLEQDNAAIGQEERSLAMEMETLRQYAFMAELLDTSLVRRIEAIGASDAGRATILREDVLYPVRRRRQEILTQLAVVTQGFAALRIVEDNNRAVIRAIASATTTTAAALRTAVMVAQAMSSQRLMLEQLEAANAATSGMADEAAATLRDHAAGVRAAVDGGGRHLAVLQRAWDEVFTSLDQVDTYKAHALDAITATDREMAPRRADAEPAGGADHAPELRLK